MHGKSLFERPSLEDGRNRPKWPFSARDRQFFKVSISCVIKLMQQVDATDDVAPARFDGFKASPLVQREADMGAWIEERSDSTLAELQTKLEVST